MSAWGCRFNQGSTSHQCGGLYGWPQSLRQDARRRSRGWETSSSGFQTKQIQTITRKKSLITFILMSKGSQMPTVPEKLVSILVNSCAKVSSSVALFAGTFICLFFFVCFIYSEHLKGLGAFPITLVTVIGQLHRKCISYQWKLLSKLLH